VARFAHASIWRVLGVAGVFGLLAGIVVSWLASTRWAPVLDEAIAALPETGLIEGGIFHWPERTGRLLAANQFTAFEVVLQEFRSESTPVDLAFEFRTNRLVVRTLFGSSALPYPKTRRIELNRTALSPMWGAWKAPILFGLIPVTAIVMLMTWSILAVPYCLVPLVIGGIFRRDLAFQGAWKLGVAAQLFGGLIMAFALALYAMGQISVLFVAALFVAHFLPTIFYLLISPFFVPKREKIGANPFETDEKKVKGRKNPFAG
jgi:hypothetical protein